MANWCDLGEREVSVTKMAVSAGMADHEELGVEHDEAWKEEGD
jgi:hypothetical protein